MPENAFPDNLIRTWSNACARSSQIAFNETFPSNINDACVLPNDGDYIPVENLLSRTLRTRVDIWDAINISENVPDAGALPEMPTHEEPIFEKTFNWSIFLGLVAIAFLLFSQFVLATIFGFLCGFSVFSALEKCREIDSSAKNNNHAKERAYDSMWLDYIDRFHEALKKKSDQLEVNSSELFTESLPDDASQTEREAYIDLLRQRLASLVYESNEKRCALIEKFQNDYMTGEHKAVANFLALAAVSQPKPVTFPRDGNLVYKPDTKTLVLDTELPSPDLFSALKKVRISELKSGPKMKITDVSDRQAAKVYDAVVYELVLGAIYWLFSYDEAQHAAAIVVNGFVNYTHKGNGNRVMSYILSLQVTREQFQSIDLNNVNSKECFRHLKGVGSPQLYDLVPISPIVQLNRDDKRFVDSVDVADCLNPESNLAAIGWEDFEQLIREIFEKEFSSNGGEVKVTRASRDGGVDAVAFDPDPIRGGKIVIQAKRYTNTVDVSAVRDLYGTVMNEGATKGILVTTSSFGPDAYTFAKDKPLTLLDGSNLLYLLERHGHRAYIDLAEAKKLNNDPLLRRKMP